MSTFLIRSLSHKSTSCKIVLTRLGGTDPEIAINHYVSKPSLETKNQQTRGNWNHENRNFNERIEFVIAA
jgi:hypothetical protein